MATDIHILSSQASALVQQTFSVLVDQPYTYVPGRINLIGEHIDYYNLDVLPMAIGRAICIASCRRADSLIRVVSADYKDEVCTLSLLDNEAVKLNGSWVNYLLAAKRIACKHWNIEVGIDAAITSDLPMAAGLSSSSALIAGLTLALLQANNIHPTVVELMRVLPEGEQFVGTRGGGMDHAAVLAGKVGCALQISFQPFRIQPIPVPVDWRFLVAHSLTTAEKSGAVRHQYNALRAAGDRILKTLSMPSYTALLKTEPPLSSLAFKGIEQRVFTHVCQEAARVQQAVEALRNSDFDHLGALLNASHRSLRDQLQISNDAVDSLVQTALQAGAVGARMTGAGFGGCVIALCRANNVHKVQELLKKRYYSVQHRDQFQPESHLFIAEPSAGAFFE